jgi:hypothetical protein
MFEVPASLATPLACGVATLSMLSLVLSADLRGYGASKLFAYHGAFMVVGFVMLLPLGALSYTADCGKRGNDAYPDRASRRVAHGTLNMLAGFFIVLGYLVAFVEHQASPRPAPNSAISTHLPFSLPAAYSPRARSAHVIVGWAALAGTVAMMLSGLAKFVAAHKGARVFAGHGFAGPVVWLLGMLNIAIAAYFEYGEIASVAAVWPWYAPSTQ